MQCDKGFNYNPCVSACPAKSCDNQYRGLALYETCTKESCVEGNDL